MDSTGSNVSLVISRASLDDAEAIIKYLNSVGGESDFLTFGFNEFWLSVDEERKVILDTLAHEINLMLVAKVDNIIVAQLFVQRSNKERLRHIGEISLSVSRAYWGKSIGLQLMLDAIEWAKKKNISKLQLQVRCDNDRAIRLYQKLGFSIDGKIHRALKIGSLYFDEHLMGLCL
jgi:ribosomal protein S18 acetylase RimI-like enzyme